MTDLLTVEGRRHGHPTSVKPIVRRLQTTEVVETPSRRRWWRLWDTTQGRGQIVGAAVAVVAFVETAVHAGKREA